MLSHKRVPLNEALRSAIANFRVIHRTTPYLLPASVEDWLPKNHLARFVVDTETMMVVATGMAQVATDKQPVEPMLKTLASLPEVLRYG